MPISKLENDHEMNSSKKYFDFFLVILIFIILVSPLLYWFSLNGKWETASEIEGRKLKDFPKDLFRSQLTAVKRVFQGLLGDAIALFFFNTLNDDLQNRFNIAVADQFPLRIRLTEITRILERGLIASAYSLLPDPVLPTSTASSYFVTRDKTRLLKPPISFGEETKHEIDLRIENYSELIKANPNINFYVLNIEPLEYSKFNPLAQYYGDSDSGQSLAYFLKNKPKNLQFRNFGISSYSEFEANFFRTDHHWNIHGALKAYRQVYEMLSSHYPEISQMVDISKIGVIKGLKGLGSYARGSLYPVAPEPFEYADVSLPEYKTYVNGELKILMAVMSIFRVIFQEISTTTITSGFMGIGRNQLSMNSKTHPNATCS